MAEEFENYDARVAAARRAVERWEAEGGARETEQPAERALDAVPDGDPTLHRESLLTRDTLVARPQRGRP